MSTAMEFYPIPCNTVSDLQTRDGQHVREGVKQSPTSRVLKYIRSSTQDHTAKILEIVKKPCLDSRVRSERHVY